MADDKEVEKTIAEDLVVTKYKLAGQIVNSKLFVQWFLSDIIGISLGTTQSSKATNRRVSCHRHAGNVPSSPIYKFLVHS